MATETIITEEKTANANNTATTVGTGTKKAPARRGGARKTVAKAAAAKTEKKTLTKRAPKAETKPAVTETMILQFGGREIDEKSLFQRAHEIWSELGHDAAELTDVKLYIKPDELAAYYVLNGEVTGCINL